MAIDLGLTVAFVNNASAGLRGLANDVNRVGNNAQATANRLKAIQVVIGGILLTKTIQWGKSLLDAAAANQTLDMRMAHFVGGATKANELMHRLNTQFAGSGLVVDDLAGSFIKLQSTFGDAAKSETVLSSITNSVLAMGGGAQAVDNLATSFQRMAGTGTASQRELKSLLTGTGISLAEMAEAAGMSFTHFDQNMRKGLMDADSFIDAFVKASKVKFGDFAENMKFTIGGSMQRISNVWSQALGDIGKRTDLFERLALFFNKIADGVKAWADSIDQADIDTFFGILADFEPIARTVGKTILDIGTALIVIADIGAKFMSVLPPSALEFGLIGYFVFGKKGALVLGTLGFIGEQIGHITTDIIVAMGLGQAAHDLMKSGQGLIGGDISNSVFAGDTAKIKALLDNLRGKQAGKEDGGTSDAANEFLEKQAAFIADLGRAADDAKGKLRQMNFELSGDKLGAQIGAVTEQTDNWKASLQNLLEKNKDLPIDYQLTATQLKIITDLIGVGGAIDQGLAKQVEQIRQVNEELQFQAQMEQGILRRRLEGQTQDLVRSANKSGLFNAARGTSAGELVMEVERQRLDLLNQIDESQIAISEIQLKIKENAADPTMVNQLELSAQKYRDMRAAAAGALEGLSEMGLAQKDLWASVGQTLESGVASSLAKIAQGTFTLKDFSVQMFNEITAAAARYLTQLILIEGVKSAFGFSLGGFANGGAFKGGITPFANGGIVRGPTLFGLAGEAGDEAIMPLTRIGGKLGVQSTGGGGSNVTVNISAIDTQTGIEFLMKNADTIGATLGHRALLNRRGK